MQIIDPQKTKSGSIHPNKAFQKLLFQVLVLALAEAKYIEKLGSGFLTIFKSYEEYRLRKPTLIEGENYVKCILPRIAAEEGDEESLLRLFDLGAKISVSDVITHLKLSRTTAVRRLNALLETKQIKKIGKGRGTIYIKMDQI
jgi:predicted HTH transcriptional regulator